MVPATDALGIGASVGTAALWGLGAVLARLGLVRARPSLLNLVGVVIALPILFVILVATGQGTAGVELSPSLLVLLAGVALCSQVVGTLLTYDSIRFIGAARNVTISSTRIVFSSALGVALVGESLTKGEALGSSLVVAGILALSLGPREAAGIRGFRMGRGMSEALAGAFVFSVGNVLIRLAAVAVGSPALANFLADLLALPMLLVVVAADTKGLIYTGLDPSTWRVLLLTGAVFALSSYTFFVALSVAPVVYVIPLSSSSPLFAIAFSFAAIRDMERVNRTLVLGALFTVAGSLLIASAF